MKKDVSNICGDNTLQMEACFHVLRACLRLSVYDRSDSQSHRDGAIKSEGKMEMRTEKGGREFEKSEKKGFLFTVPQSDRFITDQQSFLGSRMRE